MHSSTRVGSVALLGNQEKVEYYRNDSLKYCRHEEEKKKKPKGREGRRAFIERLWGAGSPGLHRLKVGGRIIILSRRVLTEMEMLIG
jgi:hypothetical protein